MRTLVLFVLAVALTTPPSLPTATGESISATTHALPVHGEVPCDYALPEKHRQPEYRGVDLNVSPGQPIHASAPGVVRFAGSIAGMIPVSIMHADGIRTTYQSTGTALEKGNYVIAGQVVGHPVVNAKHSRSGLHWDALRSKDYLNPPDLIQRRPTVLKPVRN